MGLGLTFNGKHCKNFGLHMKTINRPILPEPKIIVEEIPGADGEIDFTEANPLNRTLYKPRIHEIQLSLIDTNFYRIRSRAHEIAAWLACGEKQLVYDDEPTVFYLARVSNKLDIAQQLTKLHQFTVQFKCRPFAYSFHSAEQPLQFDGSWGFGYGYKFSADAATYTITGPKTLSVYNPGTYAKPLIRVSGSFTTLSFTFGSKVLSCNSAVSNGVLEIDFDNKTSVLNSNTNYLGNMTGNFWEFVHGDNILQIGGTGLNCTVSLIFKYLYL